MTEDQSKKIEAVARSLAAVRGSAIIGRVHGETVTIASQHGYGLWAHSPEKYANNH